MYVSVCSLPPSKHSRLPLLLPGLLLLAACASQRGVDLPDISEWDQRVRVLSAVETYDFNGRVAVKAGAEGFNGKLRWQQEAENRFQASVSGPLGIGTVRLAGDGTSVSVTDKDGVETRLDDVETDLYLRYGWTIPVESLRFWALGIPDPRVPAVTEFSAAGELVRLVQRGWTVEIGRYQETSGGQQMPSRLSAQNPETSVRLVIDRWVFH